MALFNWRSPFDHHMMPLFTMPVWEPNIWSPMKSSLTLKEDETSVTYILQTPEGIKKEDITVELEDNFLSIKIRSEDGRRSYSHSRTLHPSINEKGSEPKVRFIAEKNELTLVFPKLPSTKRQLNIE